MSEPEALAQQASDEYTYCYVTCGRKAWHLGDAFDGWAEHYFDRGDYTERHVFRKKTSDLTAEDRGLVAEFGKREWKW